jgi:hypothetical protein
MQQSKPSSDAERPDDNPYAPPLAETRPGGEEKDTDLAVSRRKEHVARETCIRVTGLVNLIVAAILTSGLVVLSVLILHESSGKVSRLPWLDISLAVIAIVTSWGLYRLRNWGRWALTIVTMLPVPVLVCGGLVLHGTKNSGLQDRFGYVDIGCWSLTSAGYSLPLLFLLWSPKGRMVFSPGYRETIRQTPDQRPGWSGILPALLFIPPAFASYMGVWFWAYSILELLGLNRPI